MKEKQKILMTSHYGYLENEAINEAKELLDAYTRYISFTPPTIMCDFQINNLNDNPVLST